MDLEYKIIANNIEPLLVSEIINEINSSEKFEIARESVTGKLNHIVVKNTNFIVGYIGADNSYELVNPNNSECRNFYYSLIKIYNDATFKVIMRKRDEIKS